MAKEIVEAVQSRLAELKFYDGRIDGDAGPKTEAALADFKGSIGFAARPYPVMLTLPALFDEEAKPRPTPIEVPGPDGEPAWMVEARSKLGLHEVQDYAELAAWLRSDGATLGDPRKLPWCGDFVATVIRNALSAEPLPKNPYLARNWLEFGTETKPRVGAVLVFWRGSRSGISGHVGFYVGEDATAYRVLGGNQSNAVTLTRIAKSRLLGARWPRLDRSSTGAVQVDAEGALSTNEA